MSGMDPNALSALNEFVQDFNTGSAYEPNHLALYAPPPSVPAQYQYTAVPGQAHAQGQQQYIPYGGEEGQYEYSYNEQTPYEPAPPPPSDEGMAPPPPPDFDENETEVRRQTDLSNYDFSEPDSEKNFIRDSEGRLKACTFGKLIGLLTAANNGKVLHLLILIE